MNKSDLVDAVASSADVTKASAGRAVDAVLDSIGDALGKGDTVSLVGFGTFSVRHRAAREGRNPQTGAAMHIAASKVPGFKAGKGLKDKVKKLLINFLISLFKKGAYASFFYVSLLIFLRMNFKC